MVTCLGQKMNSATVNNVTSCVFDELLIFNFKDLNKEQIEEGLIKISVLDAGFMGKTKMIGASAFDMARIFQSNTDHELYRKWIVLMDDEDPNDVGVQGYLKISIQIIGPGDKIKVHDVDADIKKERAEEAAKSGDVGSLALSQPTARKEWKFLVVSVYRAESLPVMNYKSGNGGTDAFVQVRELASLTLHRTRPS